ncbi:MAG: glycosyltransferase, partial [Elusimicrobiota bacterium]
MKTLPNIKKINVLNWPSSYFDAKRGKPYDCIFIKEHIKSVASHCENRILYISPDLPTGNRLFEIQKTIEDGINTDRIYFKTIRPLWMTNIYVRIVLFFYFLRLIIVERFYPDILHIHFYQSGLLAILFCKLFRIRMVVTEHWSAFIGWPEL